MPLVKRGPGKHPARVECTATNCELLGNLWVQRTSAERAADAPRRNRLAVLAVVRDRRFPVVPPDAPTFARTPSVSPQRQQQGTSERLYGAVRCGGGSTLITSQLPVEAWHEVIGEPTFADAILDRLVHNAYRLALDGPSIRKLKAGEAEAVGSTTDTANGVASVKPAKGAKK